MSAVGFKRLLPIILVASILTPISTVAKAAETVTEVSFPDGWMNVRWIFTIKHQDSINCPDEFCSFKLLITKSWIKDMSAGSKRFTTSDNPSLPYSNSGISSQTYEYLELVDTAGKQVVTIWGAPIETNKEQETYVMIRYSEPTKIQFRMKDSKWSEYNLGFKVIGNGITVNGPTQEQKKALEEESVRAQDWDEESDDDGFTSYFQISKGSSDNTVRIGCEKRKLYVVVMTPYASSYGWTGSGQYKIDKQKPVKFSYTVSRNFRGVFMNNPKSFTSKLLKSKENFSFKMSSVLETYTFEHTKGNISDYQNKFKSMGCSLK